MDYRYEGFYARFEAPSKKTGSLLVSADVLVGDPFEIVIDAESPNNARIVNRFGEAIGSLDANATRRIKLAQARDQIVHAYLAFVAYSELPDPGVFWGNMAIVCLSKTLEDAFADYLATLSKRLGSGVRPNIELGAVEIDRILANRSWFPSSQFGMPEMPSGSAIVKHKLSLTERIVEQGRKRNPLMYVVSILFTVAVVGGIIWLIAGLFV